MCEKSMVLQFWSKILSANQIRYSLIFPELFPDNHQYIWKKLTDPVNFLHGDNHQRKVASETTTSG